MQLGYSHHIENKSTVKRGFDKNQMFKEKRIFEYDLPKPDVIVKPVRYCIVVRFMLSYITCYKKCWQRFSYLRIILVY